MMASIQSTASPFSWTADRVVALGQSPVAAWRACSADAPRRLLAQREDQDDPLPPPFPSPSFPSSPLRRPSVLRPHSRLRRLRLRQPPRHHTRELTNSTACPYSTTSAPWVNRWVKVEGKSPNQTSAARSSAMAAAIASSPPTSSFTLLSLWSVFGIV
jgi:hypothetical protein